MGGFQRQRAALLSSCKVKLALAILGKYKFVNSTDILLNKANSLFCEIGACVIRAFSI